MGRDIDTIDRASARASDMWVFFGFCCRCNDDGEFIVVGSLGIKGVNMSGGLFLSGIVWSGREGSDGEKLYVSVWVRGGSEDRFVGEMKSRMNIYRAKYWLAVGLFNWWVRLLGASGLRLPSPLYQSISFSPMIQRPNRETTGRLFTREFPCIRTGTTPGDRKEMDLYGLTGGASRTDEGGLVESVRENDPSIVRLLMIEHVTNSGGLPTVAACFFCVWDVRGAVEETDDSANLWQAFIVLVSLVTSAHLGNGGVFCVAKP